MSETLDNTQEAGKRPVFLTVVCILSFVGIGLAIIGYAGAFALLGAAESGLSAAADAGATVTASTGMIWAYIIVGFLSTIIALVGVIQMWKLKKSGFMLYTAAQVIGIILTVMVYGFGGAAMGIVFAAAFIIMYGVNLKHMS
ncbi:MAG: hypothetical protein Crog4KO_02030 [Crocinitomicaceae bacterium]